ncbi:MAG TPA: glycoside hydrolase family 15 protein [Chloroflexota bacterium]|nr:glycoside hydrolase family 15 protein [Chloroflexota bacterium]
MANVDERGYRPIEDYAIIGNPRVAALVAKDGSIDWWCWPRFDSPAVFCRLLDAQKGGHFQVEPTDGYESTRAYVDSTNVLETMFKTSTGTVRLTDFVSVRPNRTFPENGDTLASVSRANRIFRLIEGVAGETEVAIRFRPSFDFARKSATFHQARDGAIATDGEHTFVFVCPVPLSVDSQGGVAGRVQISQGQRIWLVLGSASDHDSSPSAWSAEDAESELSEALAYWQEWAKVCSYQGDYRPLVLRSALALKLLTYEPTGALIAAPTTSLPEQIGGIRNWDYRYTWLRDSALILEALHSIGYHDEANAFFQWLCPLWFRDRGQLKIMYTIEGDAPLPEKILSHLEGYAKSTPVRVGNAAASQSQLDIYGEVLDAAHYTYFQVAPVPEIWTILRHLADLAAAHWHEADAGIWEVRGGQQQFVYSKLLCWVAVDRAIDLCHTFQLDADTSQWEKARADIREAILTQGYDEKLGAFTQVFGKPILDASVLAIPLVGFLPATDPRMLSTIRQIQEKLTVHGLVQRYRADDGLPPGDGSFTMCSFWLVDALALSGQIDEARALFEKVVSYANDVGLLAEEIDPVNGQLLGNFPQGFSHLALIRSALHIARSEKYGPEEDPKSRSERASQITEASQADQT